MRLSDDDADQGGGIRTAQAPLVSAPDASDADTLLAAIRRIAAARDVSELGAAVERAICSLTGAQEATFLARAYPAVTEESSAGHAIALEDSTPAEQGPLPGFRAVVPVGPRRDGGAIVASWPAPSVARATLEVLNTVAETAAIVLDNIQLRANVRDSAERFRLMADTSPVMIWVTDASGHIEFVNRTYCRFFGIREEDVQGPGGWQPLVHPDDLAPYLEGFLESLRAGQPFFGEARVRRADGEWRWVASYTAPHLSADGRVLGAVGSSPDITEIKEADLALELSERRLRAIVDSTPALVYVVDGEHKFALINREFGRLFNLEPATISGKSIYDCFPRETADEFARHNRQVLDAGIASEFEEVVQQQDGPHHYISVKAPLFDASNRALGICGVSTDITQQKHLVSALEAAHRAKDAFVATVAHELRQPLGAIQAGLAVIRMRPDRAVEDRAGQIIERQVAQLARLTDDLLDAASIAQGKVALRRERVTLNSVLDGALAVVTSAIQQASQRLDVSIPGEPVWVLGDTTRLQQVFSNLLTNAAKFTDAGGHISLGVDLTPDTAVVRVRDNGRGIPPEVLPHIFDLFAQETADGRGLGIGLSVVHGLVAQHGGTVEARSGGIGQGSEFVVTLPLAADSSSAPS